jgi:hypothetical protein
MYWYQFDWLTNCPGKIQPVPVWLDDTDFRTGGFDPTRIGIFGIYSPPFSYLILGMRTLGPGASEAFPRFVVPGDSDIPSRPIGRRSFIVRVQAGVHPGIYRLS